MITVMSNVITVMSNVITIMSNVTYIELFYRYVVSHAKLIRRKCDWFWF